MNALERWLTEKKFENLIRAGDGYNVSCPGGNHARGDQKPSLSFSLSPGGNKILGHCHAGCTPEEWLQGAGLQNKDLYLNNEGKQPAEIIAIYNYVDKQGRLKYQVCRDRNKGFLQRQPDGKGGYRWNLHGVEPLIYRLPEVNAAILAGELILITEGEKDADAARQKFFIVATTNSGGAGKWKAELSEHLKGATVAILPDNDPQGKKHAAQVAENLRGTADSVKVIELPNLPAKGDFSDWLETGGTKEALLLLIEESPEWEAEDLAPTAEHETDLGNARRFVKQAAGNIRFLTERKKWFCWNGKRWETDRDGAAVRQAKETVRSIYGEAEASLDDNDRKAIARHAIRSESEGKIRAMISLAESEIEIPIYIEDLDRDPWLLNCENGTLNLQTGELQPHKRSDFITKICPVEYDPEAQADLFNSFLGDVLPDPEVRRYVQKALGYSITGDASLEKLFFPFGPPATGKTTLLSAVEACLGDYAATADFESFLQRERITGAARNDIARLAGKRFVLSVEVADGKKLAESLVNQLTGGDTVAARYLYAESFEFKPQFKLWLAANNRPRVSGPEAALWRRLVQIPFAEVIPEEKRDPAVKARLCESERAAVFAWLVSGCLLYLAEGLIAPRAVVALTSDYREESDIIKEFLLSCCFLRNDQQVAKSDLYKGYQLYCSDEGIRPNFRMSKDLLSKKLIAKNFESFSVGHKNIRTWGKISLNEDMQARVFEGES